MGNAWNRAHPEHNRRLKWHSRLKRQLGLSVAEFDAQLIRQLGLCAICHTATELDLDHDHKTGKVRALLCCRCNLYVGFVEAMDVRLVLNYLARFK